MWNGSWQTRVVRAVLRGPERQQNTVPQKARPVVRSSRMVSREDRMAVGNRPSACRRNGSAYCGGLKVCKNSCPTNAVGGTAPTPRPVEDARATDARARNRRPASARVRCVAVDRARKGAETGSAEARQ
jgi:hypothetical protein